jgi:uncharacterized protein
MEKIQLKILGISTGNVGSSYTLILEEVHGSRKLPIIIGIMEAQAIAIELEKIVPARPMTHDLIKSLSLAFNLEIQEVVIHKLFEGVFYANLVISNGSEIKNIDSRTSDAIALAVRFNCPIYTYENILAEAGLSPDEGEGRVHTPSPRHSSAHERNLKKENAEKEIKNKKSENLNSLPLTKLKKMLKNAVNDEDYILAAKLRDIIRDKELEDSLPDGF